MKKSRIRAKRRQSDDCRQTRADPKLASERRYFRVHPLFLLVGAWYALRGRLFLFLTSAVVAVQHECAHAFAAARLGYRLNRIVLMPFGAIIDGDLRDITFKDALFVAACGPLCNLCTALFFIAIWWIEPTMYAFTDTAVYASLTIAAVNLLPAYPLDGGRILHDGLCRIFLREQPREDVALRKADRICRALTCAIAVGVLAAFLGGCLLRQANFSLLPFGAFLLVGAFGNREERAVYEKMRFFRRDPLKRGAEIRHVAIKENCPVKNALRFLSREGYLVLEVYDEAENYLFRLTQNELSDLFLRAENPYESLGELYRRGKPRDRAVCEKHSA